MAILALSEVGQADVVVAGGKGANLGELVRAGFPVPPGFVVSPDVYRAACAGAGAGADAVVAQLLGYEFDAALEAAIAAAHEALQGQRSGPVVYAVRSSATAEDLGDASFAGQHETFYEVGIGELNDAIRRCWASLWSEPAVAYRDTQGIRHTDVAMAVVVQEMIASDVSGITFTANPLTGSGDEIVTDAVWGMGSAIVDGKVTPDHFVVARDSGAVVTEQIAEKTRMVQAGSAADALSDVPEAERRKPTLSADQLAEVTRWAVKSEAHFGKPQDLEWAFSGGRYFMLQSRPITTLEADEDLDTTTKLVIYKPIAENFTDPLLPLTEDLTSLVVSAAFFYRGRVYQGIAPVRAILPLHITDDQAAELLYWEMPQDLELKIRWTMVPVSLLVATIYYLMFGLTQARSRAMPDNFMDTFRGLFRKVDKDPELTPAQAMMQMLAAPGAFAPVGRWILFINVTAVLRYFILMGVLNRLLKRWIPDVSRDAGSLLCSGSTGVLSTEMGRSITALANLARGNADVSRILQTYPREEIIPALKATSAAAAFIEALDGFLAVHGHRALKEFEMASPRFEEDPTPVLAMIGNYLKSNANPDAMAQQQTDRRVELAHEIRGKLGGWRWKVVEYLSDRARYFIKLRENSRFFHIMAWYAARKKVLRVERRLMDLGRLKVKGDVFYLLWAEVEALLSAELTYADVEERIRARRMRHVRWSKQTPPKTLNIESTRQAPVAAADGALVGQGASPGVYEGIARVILDPRVDANIAPGEILVAPFTDPAWTPLFLVARAAVVGVGSYLSHAGTIAREYGMPCVVNVDGCTEKIRTGDRLRVDGTEGTVHLLSKDEAGSDQAGGQV